MKFFFFLFLISLYLLTVNVSPYYTQWHTHTHTQTHNTHSVGLLWMRDRPVAETSTCTTTQHKQETDINSSWGIRTRNPNKGAATGIKCHLWTANKATSRTFYIICHSGTKWWYALWMRNNLLYAVYGSPGTKLSGLTLRALDLTWSRMYQTNWKKEHVGWQKYFTYISCF